MVSEEYGEYDELSLIPGDRLLLCTDGLTKMVEDDEIRHMVMKYANAPQDAVQKLVKKANEYGGKDNISIIIISLKQE